MYIHITMSIASIINCAKCCVNGMCMRPAAAGRGRQAGGVLDACAQCHTNSNITTDIVSILMTCRGLTVVSPTIHSDNSQSSVK